MRHFAFVLAAVALLALATEARADDWSLDSFLKQHNQSDWAGHGVGTMVHRKGFSEMSMPQMPEPQRQETEQKQTLVKITDDAFVVKVEIKTMGQWQTEEKSEPKGKNWTHAVEDLGTETVSVDGTDYECQKKKVTWKDGETVKETSILSVHPEKGILKMVMGDNQEAEITVSKLDASWTVGASTLQGREMTMTVTTPMGKLNGSVHICLKVPDGMVRQEMKSGPGAMQMHQVTELVEFVQK